MTEEEEKSLNRCEELTKVEHANWIGISNQKAIATILNLIQKLQEEKENYKRMLSEIHAQSLNNSIAEKEKYEEQLEALNEGWKIELEKKDTIINEMAEVMSAICTGITSIRELFEKSYCEFINSEEDCCWKTDKTCKDCVIQYFENKAEQSSSISTIQEEK